VRLVHFHFGSLSEQRSWVMQQAMEQHCLYAAKGMVKWLGHSDIDEYFQVTDPELQVGVTVKDILARLSKKKKWVAPVPAVSVQSQLWFFASEADCQKSRFFPCDMTCKVPDYNSVSTKLIINPDAVDYFSVHLLTRYRGQLYDANPWNELRVNHFKYVNRSSTGCADDSTFQDGCKIALGYNPKPGKGRLPNTPSGMCKHAPFRRRHP